MKILGIIAEYNPFHNGHKLHLEESKKITGIQDTVVLMSGNFVQRGEPAMLDKFIRTKMALNEGCDLVLELPTIFSSSSAEKFSHSSIYMLNETNMISDISYGSEIDNILIIKETAKILAYESNEFKLKLKEELNKGNTYPKARENALIKLYPSLENILTKPNNILGIEYEKAIIRLNSKIKTHTIARNTSEYNNEELSGEISSATAIRKCILNDELEKTSCALSIENYILIEKNINEIANINNLYQILAYKILTTTPENLKNIEDINEGIENKILNELKNSTNMNELFQKIKSKRYTRTKLQRTILHIILNIEKNTSKVPNYVRVLGFRKNKEYLLKNLCRKSNLPVITNLKNAEKILLKNSQAHNDLLEELVYSDIYNLAKNNMNFERLTEFQAPLVIV